MFCRELDRVKVKGKDQAVTIYEPLGLKRSKIEHRKSDRRGEATFWKKLKGAYILARHGEQRRGDRRQGSADLLVDPSWEEIKTMYEHALGLYQQGDFDGALQGRADIRFTDQSLITLDVGTTAVIEEQQQPTGILRRIGQTLGSLWFNIQQIAGTETELTTPTAVAAIRGTEGRQLVPNDTQSTHALNEGIEDITENITQQTVTITDGQQVTAIRGVGFTPIVALLAAIPKPGVGGGGAGGGAAGGGAAGAGGGAAGGVAGAAAGAATSTVSTVATVAAATAAPIGGAAAAVIAATAKNEPPAASATAPLNFPGGG